MTLAGTWFEPGTGSAPAVILVHMLGRSRHDWDQVGAALAAQGIGALSFDLRGHGDSQGPRPSDGGYSIFLQDLAAARRYVAARPDVLPSRIAYLGASIGANLAVLQAAQAPGIAGLALLSPSTDYRGLRIDAAVRKYPGRTLMVASDDDPYAQRSVRELLKAAGGAGTLRETMVVPHAGHGTVMLGRDPDLVRALVDWLRRTLQ
jgi:pimeloyl-ACP methyl ester carboxylesterase